MDSKRPPQGDRYRDMAEAIRALIPNMEYQEAAEEMRLLANRYERLAEYLEAAPYPPQDTQQVVP